MDVNAEVSAQISLIDVLLSNLDKTITPCSDKQNEQKREEAQNEMPDSTTNTEKNNANPFHCGDDVLLPNKDGKYYLGTIVELSTNNDNDSCEVGTGVARCLVKFGDGTHAWAPVSRLKLLSAPPADDGRIMCVVCKRREPTSVPTANAIIACDMCGRGYHAKCHSPPVDAWINGASWNCKRCVDQRYKVAAAENRALKRSDMLRFKGSQQRRQQQDLTPPCDTASSTASIHSDGANDQDPHCYCGEKKDYLAQMLQCCRCSRWFHQRCVSSLRYPLYAGDKLYIFACGSCNGGGEGGGGEEYLRRLELCWLELAHLALYNLTAYNAPNYFDLDTVIMPYIMDNWHALQLPEKMWRTPVNERRERILTALTSSRKRFKCGREMKKRATIWGLRLRRPPPPPAQLAQLEQVKKGVPLTDALVREYAPRLRFLPRTPFPPVSDIDDCMQPSSSNNDKSSYKSHDQSMIVPVDGHWLNLMTGKRFHENLSSSSNSENDSNSTCSSESLKPTEVEEPSLPSPSQPSVTCTATESDAKADEVKNEEIIETTNEATPIFEDTPKYEVTPTYEIPPVPSLVQCTVKLDKISKDELATPTASCRSEADTSLSKSDIRTININTHSSRIATMNLEVSKLSTKNIIEHSKIMSLQHMDQMPVNSLFLELDSSGDEASRRGTLDTFIPPLKDFHGINNPFLMQFKHPSKKALVSSKQNGRQNHLNARLSLPMQLNPVVTLGRPIKRKLSEKDIVIGPNGEVKRRMIRKPRKYLQLQLNKSCPLPDDSNKTVPTPPENDMPAPQSGHVNNVKFHGRRLRQRQEKNYNENTRRNNTNNNSCATINSINSVKSLQLSPHKGSGSVEVDAEQLSVLKTSVQSYFRAGQTFRVLARRKMQRSQPAYLIEWDTTS